MKLVLSTASVVKISLHVLNIFHVAGMRMRKLEGHVPTTSLTLIKQVNLRSGVCRLSWECRREVPNCLGWKDEVALKDTQEFS